MENLSSFRATSRPFRPAVGQKRSTHQNQSWTILLGAATCNKTSGNGLSSLLEFVIRWLLKTEVKPSDRSWTIFAGHCVVQQNHENRVSFVPVQFTPKGHASRWSPEVHSPSSLGTLNAGRLIVEYLCSHPVALQSFRLRESCCNNGGLLLLHELLIPPESVEKDRRVEGVSRAERLQYRTTNLFGVRTVYSTLSA